MIVEGNNNPTRIQTHENTNASIWMHQSPVPYVLSNWTALLDKKDNTTDISSQWLAEAQISKLDLINACAAHIINEKKEDVLN